MQVPKDLDLIWSQALWRPVMADLERGSLIRATVVVSLQDGFLGTGRGSVASGSADSQILGSESEQYRSCAELDSCSEARCLKPAAADWSAD